MNETTALVIGVLAGIGVGAFAVWMLIQFKQPAQATTEEIGVQYVYDQAGHLTQIIRLQGPK